MDNVVEAKIKLINDKIKFSCKVKDNPEIITDYIPPLGNNEGYMPLEVFLISLAACTSGTILPLLKTMRKTVGGFEMKIEGTRKRRTSHIFQPHHHGHGDSVQRSGTGRSRKSLEAGRRKVLSRMGDD